LLREGRNCQQKSKKEAEDFHAAFYGSSPRPWLSSLLMKHLSLMAKMLRCRKCWDAEGAGMT
jgi:hypothetical protein